MLNYLSLSRHNIGNYVIIGLTLIPLLFWYPHANVSGVNNIFLAAGQVLGLMGSVLFSLNFMLSARLRFLEKYFGGLNRIYIIHHIIGAIALIFLLYHPVMISLFYLPLSVVAAAKILFAGPSNVPVFLGLTALAVLIIALILTFFIKLPYQIWKLSHKFLGLSLFLASLHIYLIPSTVSVSLPLRIYILGISVVGIAAYLYRSIFDKLLIRKYKYKVEAVNKLGNDVTEAVMSPLEKPMNYLPGQFIFINFESLGITRETHPFSLTSSPDTPQLSLGIKSSGDYTETIKLLKKDAVAEIEGPFGYFTFYRYGTNRQIWIAGGIGVTPFISMARSLAMPNPYRIDMYYVVSTADEAVYQKELEKIAAQISGFKLFPHFSKTMGRFNTESLAKSSPDFVGADIFLCGPPPMMKSLKDQLKKVKVKGYRIHSEEFSID